MDKNKIKSIIGYIFYCLVISIVLSIFLLQPAFEARNFNKFRKEGTPKATYWDALWSSLRITSE